MASEKKGEIFASPGATQGSGNLSAFLIPLADSEQRTESVKFYEPLKDAFANCEEGLRNATTIEEAVTRLQWFATMTSAEWRRDIGPDNKMNGARPKNRAAACLIAAHLHRAAAVINNLPVLYGVRSDDALAAATFSKKVAPVTRTRIMGLLAITGDY